MEMIYSIHICSQINFCNNSHAIHHFHELTGPFPYFNAEGHSLKSLKAYFLVFVFLERKKSTFLHGDHVQIGVFICSLVPVPSGIVHTKQMSMLFTYSAIHFLGRIDFPTTKKSRKSWIHKGKNPETLASALQMYWYIALLPWNDIISFFFAPVESSWKKSLQVSWTGGVWNAVSSPFANRWSQRYLDLVEKIGTASSYRDLTRIFMSNVANSKGGNPVVSG